MSDRDDHERRLSELERQVAFLMGRLGVTEPDAPAPRGPAAEVENLIRAGRKIEAIKAWRESTGQGLREAKEAVEAIERRLR
jgi:ribosomal protein L7/L12